jgi:hypothetical protein
MSKLLTLTQAESIANGVLAKVKNKGYLTSADLGALASKDEVAKSDLSSALVTEIEGKANTADLGDLATLDEVAESDLASALATKINGKADAATTISGYGITDAYTKTEVDNAIAESAASVCKPGGSLTEAQILSALLVAGNVGKVYNVTEDFTTTSDFVEGSGKALPAGTNIQVIDADTTGSSPSYMFDVYAGAYGVATQSGNGLMSATDKAKLDNADVTAYSGTGPIDVTNHVISIEAASTTAPGTMSAADKAKLDGADVTPYTAGNGIDVTNHVISAVVDNSNANGLSVGANGLTLAPATTNAAGAMSAADKTKLDDITIATASEVETMIAGLDNL